ncbi:hypothetical protein D3C73_1401080 [compost metagenome]
MVFQFVVFGLHPFAPPAQLPSFFTVIERSAGFIVGDIITAEYTASGFTCRTFRPQGTIRTGRLCKIVLRPFQLDAAGVAHGRLTLRAAVAVLVGLVHKVGGII